jgi:putative ABC transport system permease protein
MSYTVPVHARVAARLLTVEALRSFARNKTRAGLAILAVMVAVATVIWVVAIGRAGRAQAEADLDKLGDNLVWVEAGARSINGLRTGTYGMNTLLPSDANAIRDEVTRITSVSENVDGRVQVIAGTRNWSTTFRGVAPEYLEIKRWQLARGVFLEPDDIAHARRVVVLGESVRRELFDDASGIGEQLRIGTVWFTVIGTLAPKGASPTGQDQDDTVIVPWTTAQRQLLGKGYFYLDDILCSAVSADAIPAARDEIDALLRERHHIEAGADADFNIRHPEDLLQARVKTSKTLQLLLLVIASISLLVGGIGVMNVMLASVAQRTREIGIRMAVGASPGEVRLQFLAEATMLTVVAGAAGVVLAHLAGALVEHELGWPMVMSSDISAGAVVFSMVVGLFFGMYPAHRAAQLDPIAALRIE